MIENHRGLIALSSREIARFMKVWTQTLVAPVIASALFVIVFGLSLGDRIREIAGFPYDAYIVPGLIAMTMAQAAYSNNAFSLFQARFDRYLHDVLAAPMRGWEVNLALNFGGAVRALIIGGALAAIAMPITGTPVREPFVLVLAILLMLTLFCSLGVVVGIYAETWDHTTFIQTLVIVPLSFLGGVFYSVDSLPSPWRELSHANPIFYLIETVRYGFLGVSDVSPWLALAVTGAMGAVCVAWSAYLFVTGRRLKP